MSKIAPNASARIDDAISNAEAFAQPILAKLRQVILSTDDRLVEDWKWGPNFHFKGNVCGIWGHKKHVNLIFWKGAGMMDPDELFIDGNSPKALRTIQFTDIEQVNVRILKRYIKAAIKLQDDNIQIKAVKVPIVMPDILLDALRLDHKSKQYYESLVYSRRKEFAHYIGDAKRATTQQKRLKKVMKMLKEKNGLHDKYRK